LGTGGGILKAAPFFGQVPFLVMNSDILIDVDLKAQRLTVSHSHAADVTKSGHVDVIPIAAELVPLLAEAIRASASDLVFPGPKGKRLSPRFNLAPILRRAMARAGIVAGYRHVCRKRGCKHFEDAPDALLRRCPEHGGKVGPKLWPKAKVRPIRFHDLRHTAASLLMMAGANPAAVQRIMRHSDPRITTEVYGHLSPGYLQAEVDRLHFGVRPEVAPIEATEALAVANSAPFVPVVSPERTNAETPEFGAAQHFGMVSEKLVELIGIEPTASALRTRRSPS